jgi:hypothetical protein
MTVMEICILDTQDIFKANLAQSKLEAYGIVSELRTNDDGGTQPYLRVSQGIQLYVSEIDSEKAKKILKDSALEKRS